MTPTDTHFKPDKEAEFRLYVIWKSLDHTMNSKVFEALGVTDDLLLTLADLKTQKAFGEQYEVDEGTLTDWNQHIRNGNIDPQLKELDWRYWAKQVTPKMAAALVREGIKTGDPQRFNTFMKHVHGVDDKANEVNVSISLADLVAEADEVLKEHGESVE